MYNEINGDLIELALNGKFDVIVHGCNCFCTMSSGIAVSMKNTFNCDKFLKESLKYKGDINKLGTIDFNEIVSSKSIATQNTYLGKLIDVEYFPSIIVINAYTQFNYYKNHIDGKPIDYEALTLCLRKINHIFSGKHIGLPQIGCGLAGGDWGIVKKIIKKELFNCKVTVVIYNK